MGFGAGLHLFTRTLRTAEPAERRSVVPHGPRTRARTDVESGWSGPKAEPSEYSERSRGRRTDGSVAVDAVELWRLDVQSTGAPGDVDAGVDLRARVVEGTERCA